MPVERGNYNYILISKILRVKIVEWPLLKITKKVNEMIFNIIRYQRNANTMHNRNDYLPTKTADMEMPTDPSIG